MTSPLRRHLHGANAASPSPVERILQGATLWLDAKNSVEGEQLARNLGVGSKMSIPVALGGDGFTVQRIHDWFGDGRDGVLAHNATTMEWEIYNPYTGVRDSFTFGQGGGDIPAWGKWDGVRTQVASFKDGLWWVKDHDALTYTASWYGLSGDIPLNGADFDGNGSDAIGIYRGPGAWFPGDAAFLAWGTTDDVPVWGDWVVAGTTAAGVWRPSNSAWYAPGAPGGTIGFLGVAGDVPIPGDWDGDGLLKPGVFRPSTQEWIIDGSDPFTFGTATCTPLVGDWVGAGAWSPAYWDNGLLFFRQPQPEPTMTALYGSTASADTNDPLLLPHTGENYAYLPGTSGNYLSVPTAQGGLFGLSDGLVIEVIGPDINMRPAATSYVVSNLTSGGGGGGWAIIIAASGGVTMGTHDGSGFVNYVATATAPALVDGIRASKVAGGAVTFEYLLDGVWVQQGSTVAHTAASGPGGHATAYLATNANVAQWFVGKLSSVVVRNQATGAAVFNFNAATDVTDAGATSFTATSGQTVTVNRSTSGRKTALVTRPIWLFGTDDYLAVADNYLLDFGEDDFTFLAVYRRWNNQTAYPGILQKGIEGAETSGYRVFGNGSLASAIQLSDGTTNKYGNLDPPVVDNGQGVLVAGGRNGSNVFAYIEGGLSNEAVGVLGSVSNATPFYVGYGAGAFLDAEIMAVAVWRRALTAGEIAAINDYYGTA